jgi:hypothetical protein
MPVSQVTVECPCCGREVELVLVGSAHEPDWAENSKPRRKRRSKTTADQLGSADGDVAVVGGRIQGVRSAE